LTGVDINPFWKQFGEKNEVPISNQSLNSIQNKFDVVTAHQVIEHVEDPITFMKNIKSLLRPGGILHLELPNQISLSARLRKISPKISHDYGFVQPPMHLRAYCKKTIKYLFDSLDLKSQMLFACSNTDKIWGQVREYSLPQQFYYTFTGKIGMGSLLIGVAQLILQILLV
jgi:SAM-dependent methyltransferase